MRHMFAASQWVPFPPQQVFAFFSDPANLPPLMPAWQKARIDHAFIAAPPPPEREFMKTTVAGSGSVLTISFRAVPLLPIRLRWIAIISDFDWSGHFCDTQQSGPLAYWHHCHSVSPETREGVAGALVTDKVTYALPLGILGDVAHLLAIRRQVASTFAYRQKQLLKLLPRMQQNS